MTDLGEVADAVTIGVLDARRGLKVELLRVVEAVEVRVKLRRVRDDAKVRADAVLSVVADGPELGVVGESVVVSIRVVRVRFDSGCEVRAETRGLRFIRESVAVTVRCPDIATDIAEGPAEFTRAGRSLHACGQSRRHRREHRRGRVRA